MPEYLDCGVEDGQRFRILLIKLIKFLHPTFIILHCADALYGAPHFQHIL